MDNQLKDKIHRIAKDDPMAACYAVIVNSMKVTFREKPKLNFDDVAREINQLVNEVDRCAHA